jgi:hypothetical protein
MISLRMTDLSKRSAGTTVERAERAPIATLTRAQLEAELTIAALSSRRAQRFDALLAERRRRLCLDAGR